MKKFIAVGICMLAVSTFGQNLQVHYDFGEDRHFFTSTLEMYKATKKGAWFWFVDFDYNTKKKSASLAYWEIARYFNLPVLNNKLSLKLEYNDGLMLGNLPEGDYWGEPFHSAWLGGLGYSLDLKFITLQTDLLYRYMQVSNSPDWQLTLSWFEPYFNGKIVFTGFVDWWSQDLYGEKKMVFQSEPLIWYMATPNFGLGGEVEISRNFLPQFGSDWKFMPTLAVMWIF